MSDEADKDGEWHDYFAILPVLVDAYDPSEIRNGRMSWRAVGRLQRRWDTWIDPDDDDRMEHAVWRYRQRSTP